MNSRIGFNVLEFLDIDLNGAKFYLKNKNTPDFDSVAGAVNDTFYFTQYLTNPTYLLDRDSNGINHILIRVILANGQGTLYFKINLRERILANHFIGLADSLGLDIHNTMLVTNDSISSIPLPKGCDYEIKATNNANFLQGHLPKYDTETNDIRFILKPNVCREKIIITRICADCPPEFSEQFLINIKGADCDCASLPDSLENAEIKKSHIFDNPYSNECAFTFEAPPGYTIHGIVNLSDFTNITSSPNNLDSFSFQIDCMGGGGLPGAEQGGSYSKTLKILVKHKETKEICDTLTK